MERKVTVEFRLQERELVLSRVYGVNGLHTSVETDNQVIEVETNPQAIRHGQLLVEPVETESRFLLFNIIVYVPDISCVDKDVYRPR